MRFVDEFRDPEAARALADGIAAQAARAGRPMRFMEVCGGHTMSVHRFGIPQLLPEGIELLSGPGCPVCVTPTTYIDRAIDLAVDEGAIVTTFGDLYRVPGSQGSLERASAGGADVRIVYSALDALRIAQETPGRSVVFLAIGFETTAPGTAATVGAARRQEVPNFRIMPGHKTMPGAMRALVDSPEVRLDGFILPGHVTTIIGTAPYAFLPDEYGLACCVTGFEPTDILRSILSLARQVAHGERVVDNLYRRAVRAEGNPRALEAVNDVFEPVDAQWRGLGLIPGSGLGIRSEWEAFAVEPPDPAVPSAESSACLCTQVLRGLVRPTDCPLFGKTCVPESPVGACMVSSEGACSALYKYGRGI
jgi:hydrogenase expression/formation protein HypD